MGVFFLSWQLAVVYFCAFHFFGMFTAHLLGMLATEVLGRGLFSTLCPSSWGCLDPWPRSELPRDVGLSIYLDPSDLPKEWIVKVDKGSVNPEISS